MKDFLVAWRFFPAIHFLLISRISILVLACVLAPVFGDAQTTDPASTDTGEHPLAADEAGTGVTSSRLVAAIRDQASQSRALRDRYDGIVHNPISPPDTRSPRATLGSFLLIMAEASSLWLDTRDHYLSGSDLRLDAAETQNVTKVNALIDKAVLTFDLSGIPVSARDQKSIELALQLQEILDRIYLPELDEIPGVGAGATRRAAADSTQTKWIIPGTGLTIERQEDGARKGEYLFTAASVDRIPSDYATLAALPIVADTTEDTYLYYIYTPGNFIPPQWYEIIMDGPDWLMWPIAGQTVWQWIGLVVLLATLLSLIALYARWNARRPLPLGLPRRQLRRIVSPLLLILAVKVAEYICNHQFNITGAPMFFITTVGSLVFWIALSWLTYQVLQFIYICAVRNQSLNRTSLDASLLRTGFRALSFGVSILVLGYGATHIGIPIYGVIAGLGVGGLAIALAAQPTLENFIGGLILYADGIVRVGEFCAFDDLAGTVEEIGIRSTRIRALDQTLITVANADLSKRKIVNYSKREAFMFRHKIRLRHDTPSETLKAIIAAVENYLQAHARVLETPLRVRLVEYGEYSIVVDIYANISANSMDEYTAIQEQILFEIRAIVAANGARLAIPSSSIFLARDGGEPVAPAAAHSGGTKEA
ncbi:mechanosensitive ion channel [Rhodobacteraceae bacterium F11138]|nr:mechanosensitive ion channel [Rhodobacteraceae bacterium F11138]